MSWTFQMLLFIVVIHQIIQMEAGAVSCNGDCKCPSSSSPNTTCSLNCIGMDQCKDSTLTCRTGDDCLVNCDGDNSCAGNTVIDGSKAIDVRVSCIGHNACKGNTVIKCGTELCSIQCDTRSSCEGATVNADHASGLNCTGECNSFVSIPPPFVKTTANPTPATLHPTSTPTSSPTFSPTNAPTAAPTVDPLNLRKVRFFGFSATISSNSSDSIQCLLTLWFNGDLYECELSMDPDVNDTSHSCIGSHSLIDDCYVHEARAQLLIATDVDNKTEVKIENVFVITNDGLQFGVDAFCLFDGDIYTDYNYTGFHSGFRGSHDCLRDERSTDDLSIKSRQSVIISFDKSSPNMYIDNGLVEDGTYIDTKCKMVCCSNEQDVVRTRGLIGWYKAVHFDASSILWKDASSSRENDISGGSMKAINDESGIYIKADTETNVLFPQIFEDYTIFFVNRGGDFSSDCSHGERPISIETATSWGVNTHKNSDDAHPLHGRLCISNVNIKELIIYDTNLNNDDIECIESYLGSKHGIEVTKTVTFSTNIESCTEYQFIEYAAANVFEAQDLCLLQFDEHLASLHSLSDWKEAFNLCTSESYRCFLGGTDYDEDCRWEWMDDTWFDWNEWQTGEGCNAPQNNMCIFPGLWDEMGLRDCSGSGKGYPICNRLMNAKTNKYLNKTYLNVVFKVCDGAGSRDLDEFKFQLKVVFEANEMLEVGSSRSECFGLEYDSSDLVYCYFSHETMTNGDVIGLDITSNTDNMWCFNGITVGDYDIVVPFDDTECPFVGNLSCDFWKTRSEALAADQYLSQFTTTDLSLSGANIVFSKINDKYSLEAPTSSPTKAPSYSPTTQSPTSPTTAAPTSAPTVSNTHAWITFNVCNSLQSLYDEFDFGFTLVGTAGGTTLASAAQNCIESEDHTQLDCFLHSVSFIDDLIELDLQPIEGANWCFNGVKVRIADMIAPISDDKDVAQTLFSGDYIESNFVEIDLSDQVNEGVILAPDCSHSFYNRNDGAFIQCFDDLFILYPYKTRSQIAVKLHTCAVRDSGMNSASLAHLYLNIIGKQRLDEYKTNEDWISMDKPIRLSHVPTRVIQSGKVHWENIGDRVASNLDIEVDKSVKVYFDNKMEGVLVGIRYKVNGVYICNWDPKEDVSVGDKWGKHNKCYSTIEEAKERCMRESHCVAIRYSISEDKYCIRKGSATDVESNTNYKVYIKSCGLDNDKSTIDAIRSINFFYRGVQGDGNSDVELTRVYRASYDESTYIQFVNDEVQERIEDVYIRPDEPAILKLDSGSTFPISRINVDMFYILRKCEWIPYDDQDMGSDVNNKCEPSLWEAKTRCIGDTKCDGVVFDGSKDSSQEEKNQFCLRQGTDMKDKGGWVSFIHQCGGLHYEMPYISIGSYLDTDRLLAVDGKEARSFQEGEGRPTGLGWYYMEQQCRDKFSSNLASIHSKDQNLAAQLSKFELKAWVGLQLRQPSQKLLGNFTSDDTDDELDDFGWNDGTSFDVDEFASATKEKLDNNCAGIVEWDIPEEKHVLKAYDCDVTEMREALCSSYGWPSNEYRTFIINIAEQINEISMVGLSIDSEQNDAICIDEAVLMTETLYNAKGNRAWIAQNWIGNIETCDICLESGYVFFKDPVCEMEILDVTYDWDNMEVIETEEQTVGFDCENHNRFGESECSVEQSYTFTEEKSTTVSHSKETAYASSFTFALQDSVTVKAEQEIKTDALFVGSKWKFGVEVMVGTEQTWSDETTKTYSSGDEEGVSHSGEKSVSCAASIAVGKGIAQSYNLRFGKVNASIPTTQDIKLTLCTEYFPDADPNAVHEKYIDNVPGSVVYAVTTSCKVEFTAPYRLRNDYACNVEQGLAFLEQVIWMPLCNDENPALYDGCQCVIGDKLTESACSCCDIRGNPSEDGGALIVDAEFGWENTCRVLNCPNSIYAGQEVVVDTDTDSDTDTSALMDAANSAKRYIGDEIEDHPNYSEFNNNNVALSICFVGVIVGIAIICRRSTCDCSSRKADFAYQKAAMDSEEEDDDII